VCAAFEDNQSGWITAFGSIPVAESSDVFCGALAPLDVYPPAINKKSHNAMSPVNKKVGSQ
jgi:hypothetical protein